MELKIRKMIFLLISLAAVVPLYIILHEGGHGLVAVLCGARITAFSVFGAYMQYEGGVFTPTSLSLFHCGGMLLPVLAAILYMLTYRSQAAGLGYRIFSFMFLLFPLGSILAWAAVPVLYLFGMAPQGDDVTRFIDSSGVSPWVVLLGAVLLFAVSFLLAWRKRIFQNYWDVVKAEG